LIVSANVAFGSKADIEASQSRFTREADIDERHH
jgi:hypothetical protein